MVQRGLVERFHEPRHMCGGFQHLRIGSG
jgi:hypothetical protein